MTPPSAWSTQQLGEFLAAVSSFETESAAALGAVEYAAEALDAEVAAIMSCGQIVAVVGYPRGAAPRAELQSVARGLRHRLVVPGVGVCPVTAVPLEYPADGTVLVARSGTDGMSREETGMLRGMARVISMTMRMLRLLQDERALREQSERQVAENERLLATLTDRQVLLERLAKEQAALRRVAVLVAYGVPQEEVFAAVAEEVSRLAGADMVQVFRYDPDGLATRVAAWGRRSADAPVGIRYTLGGHNVSTMVLHTGRPTRIDDAAQITGSLVHLTRRLGFRSAAGSPVVVDGRLWGVIVFTSTRPEPMPVDAEHRVSAFTELVATAISNAQAREELAASRARIVAATDEARRRIERDLHDGAQQRLVSLALALRAAEAKVPAGLDELRSGLSGTAEGLTSVLDELREISRGLHPAILQAGGLGSAIKMLARRCPVPVELNVRLDRRLPEPVEVTVYYVVSEALANTAKHAQAHLVWVDLTVRDGTLHLGVGDDGIGGADAGRGSGIIGLSDRVKAFGGTIAVVSPPGKGTSLIVELPVPA